MNAQTIPNIEENDRSYISSILNRRGLYPRNISSSNEHDIYIDIVDEDNVIYIYAVLPGVSPNNIDIDVYNNKITIKAHNERQYSLPNLSEIRFGRFIRTIELPICITRRETIKTSLKDGILYIKINKLIEEENKFNLCVED